MNTKLENRKVVEKLLGPAVEEISVSPAVVTTIAEGQIDPSWVRALDELDKRSKTIDSRIKGSQKTSAMSDVKPLLDDLTNKVPPVRCYGRPVTDQPPGNRADSRFLCLPNQGFAVSEH